MKKIIYLAVLLIGIAACEDQLEPINDNHLTYEEIYRDPSYAEGLLLNGYINMPTYWGPQFNDVATDDAVSNDKTNDYREMATGQWSAQFNPLNYWNGSFEAIVYLNKLIDETDSINWSPQAGEPVRSLFNYRHKGEAYGLRAFHYYTLLQAHAGKGAGGELLGVPLVISKDDKDFAKPRSTFEACLDQIYADLDQAEKYLPVDFVDVTDSLNMPDMYKQMGASVEQYNRVFGAFNAMRLSKRIAKGIRAKVALLAASPAYGQETWSNAATYAADVLSLIGGVSGMDNKGDEFYLASNVDNVDPLDGESEVFWRGTLGKSSSIEADHFPPTLYGRGRLNPTQNLVDAFPMANGYPITDPIGQYDETNPYAGRDPRLGRYIVYNGSTFSGSTINTEAESGDDAVDAIKTSTRTGYYLRKLLREDVNLDPVTSSEQNHFNTYLRYTDIFLAYAEAANEAFGPDDAGTLGSSAREVVAAIRKRAGIKQPDTYLASVTDKDGMRELIHNERRLELCFEGHRFWDLRRWGKDLTTTAQGVRINNGVYTVSEVENRVYQNHMQYGPLPYSEVLKYNLTQNQGW